MLANAEYDVKAYFMNGTLVDAIKITLDEVVKILTFLAYQPSDIDYSQIGGVNNIDWAIYTLISFGLVGGGIY